MYTGTVVDASPIPTPTIVRPTSKIVNEPASAQISAPITKMMDVIISVTRRPSRSERCPPTSAAVAAPTSTMLTTNSSGNVDSENCCLIKITAPEIAAVSYPNSKPPTAAKIAAKITNAELFSVVWPVALADVLALCDSIGRLLKLNPYHQVSACTP